MPSVTDKNTITFLYVVCYAIPLTLLGVSIAGCVEMNKSDESTNTFNILTMVNIVQFCIVIYFSMLYHIKKIHQKYIDDNNTNISSRDPAFSMVVNNDKVIEKTQHEVDVIHRNTVGMCWWYSFAVVLYVLEQLIIGSIVFTYGYFLPYYVYLDRFYNACCDGSCGLTTYALKLHTSKYNEPLDPDSNSRIYLTGIDIITSGCMSNDTDAVKYARFTKHEPFMTVAPFGSSILEQIYVQFMLTTFYVCVIGVCVYCCIFICSLYQYTIDECKKIKREQYIQSTIHTSVKPQNVNAVVGVQQIVVVTHSEIPCDYCGMTNMIGVEIVKGSDYACRSCGSVSKVK